MYVDSRDPNGRRDFKKSENIQVTFSPSNTAQDHILHIPLVNDKFNEEIEGFFVIIDVENIASLDDDVMVELVRDGVTLVNIIDDDRKSIMISI